MKRFDIGKDQWEMDFGELYEDDRGSLVKFSEADAEIERLKKRIAELKGIIERALLVEEYEISFCSAKMADILRKGGEK